MRKIKTIVIRFALITALMIIFVCKGTSQDEMPEILSKSTLVEQMNYLQERTRIYENYRAIREDMFQKIKSNALDSLSYSRKETNSFKILTFKLNSKIDSLKNSLEESNSSLDEITKNKDSISVLGLEINKTTYNSLMWTLIAVLISTLALGFLLFKRNLVITIHTKKEFTELKKEFEVYRKTSREAREKETMALFNELRKLKGG